MAFELLLVLRWLHTLIVFLVRVVIVLLSFAYFLCNPIIISRYCTIYLRIRIMIKQFPLMILSFFTKHRYTFIWSWLETILIQEVRVRWRSSLRGFSTQLSLIHRLLLGLIWLLLYKMLHFLLQVLTIRRRSLRSSSFFQFYTLTFDIQLLNLSHILIICRFSWWNHKNVRFLSLDTLLVVISHNFIIIISLPHLTAFELWSAIL